jgi:hypothetical protein
MFITTLPVCLWQGIMPIAVDLEVFPTCNVGAIELTSVSFRAELPTVPCQKSWQSEHAMKAVVSAVNFVQAHARIHRHFQSLFSATYAKYEGIYATYCSESESCGSV